RKEFGVAVIAKIEDARKAGAGIIGFLPEAVLHLVIEEPLDAARHAWMPLVSSRHQPQHRPCRLGCAAPGSLVARIVQPVAGAVLSPAAIGVLDRNEPVDGLANLCSLWLDPDRIQAAEHRPGAVDIIDTPAPIPAAVLLLRAPQIIEGSSDGL